MDASTEQVVNLLILYQGAEAESLADQLILKLGKEIPGRIQCEPAKVGFASPDSTGRILDLYLERVLWADGAIAIVAVDPRAASETGNIWYEIGWWHARKPAQTLLICVQDHEQVQIITDYGGYIAPRFKTFEKLLASISTEALWGFDRQCPWPKTPQKQAPSFQ